MMMKKNFMLLSTLIIAANTLFAVNTSALFNVLIGGKYYGPADINKIVKWKNERRLTDETLIIDPITGDHSTVGALLKAQIDSTKSPVLEKAIFPLAASSSSTAPDINKNFFLLSGNKKYGPADALTIQKWYFQKRALETSILVEENTEQRFTVKDILSALELSKTKNYAAELKKDEPVVSEISQQQTTVEKLQPIQFPLNINGKFFVLINEKKYGPVAASVIHRWRNERRLTESSEVIDYITNSVYSVKDVLSALTAEQQKNQIYPIERKAQITEQQPKQTDQAKKSEQKQQIQSDKTQQKTNQPEQRQPRVTETTAVKIKWQEKKKFEKKWILGAQAGYLVFTGEANDAINNTAEFGLFSEKDINQNWAWQIGLNGAWFKGDKQGFGKNFDIEGFKLPVNLSFSYKFNQDIQPSKYYYINFGVIGAYLNTKVIENNYTSFNTNKYGGGALIKGGYRTDKDYEIYLKSTYEKINSTTWGGISLGASYLF